MRRPIGKPAARPLRRWLPAVAVAGALGCGLITGSPAGGAPAAEPAAPGAAKAGADSASAPDPAALPPASFVVVFSLGPKWDPAKPPPEQVGFREHGQNLGRLRKEERIVLGARYADKGMIILRAPDLAGARAELDRDPGVVAGLFTYEVHELNVFYDGCLERPKR